jgi:dTDP-4-amino-4,6-dideoxygalactose transaminase
MKINVTKSFLPPREEYMGYIDKIWNSGQLTNNGPLLKELENKLQSYLGTQYLQFCSNGTIAIQLALRGLDITCGDIITTPFSYVATTSSILWENCNPNFVDIDKDTFCIDADKIEAAITPETKAIIAVHVFGYPCHVEKIESIANKYNLKVIYDAAHAFGTKYKGKSLLSYGDISTCSFHATKLFHTGEGGAIICHDENIHEKIIAQKSFGHIGDHHFALGINGKNSEFHAAMGLSNFPYIEEIIRDRRRTSGIYTEILKDMFQRPIELQGLEYNHAYYPILFRSESHLLASFEALNRKDIFPRRYFYPSLNTLPYLEKITSCEISEDIASRIACLPLYYGIKDDDIERITKILLSI